MRACRCGAPATRDYGKPVCDDCRVHRVLGADEMRVCTECGATTVRTRSGRPICDGCKKKNTPIERSCKYCSRIFVTKTNNYECSSCQHERAKHPCSRCGVPVDRRAEVCRPCWGAEHSGDRSTSWKGGKTRHKVHGYVRVKMPDHPRAGSDGYVREHILVMEERIGRFLLPNENVHHRNGVRDDNRPENLELWTVAQPAGQRAADLLAWAREVIERYEPIEAAITAAEEAA